MNTKIIAFLLLATLGGHLTTKAQNFVPNFSFENHAFCPNNGCQWSFCTGWSNVNGNPGCGGNGSSTNFGTPDYYHTCGTNMTAPPNTFQGTVTPQDQSAMMGIILHNKNYSDYREYISTKLTTTLCPGNTYTVSFWVTNGTNPLSPWTITGIGAHLSLGPLFQNGYDPINITPTWERTTNLASNTWVQLSFVYNASQGPVDRITIGNFRNDSTSFPVQSFALSSNSVAGGPPQYAYYFIDNVSVTGPSPTVTSVVSQPGCNATGCATITNNMPSTYQWSPGGYNTSSVCNLTPGSYTVTVTPTAGCPSSTTQIIIQPSLSPTINVSSSLTGTRCAVTNVTLSASGASSYVWQPGNGTGSTYVVNPSSTTIYTVTGTSNGCSVSKTISVLGAYSLPNISISGTSTLACPSVTLTAYGSNSFTWFPGLSNGNVLVVNPTSTTVYYVFGENRFGCQNSASYTVTPGVVVNLSAPATLTYCNNAQNGVSINANSTYGGGPVTFNWVPGNMTGSPVFVSPQINTVYTVTASSPGACSSTAAVSVGVFTHCCSQPTAGLTALTGPVGGNYMNTSYYLHQSITLNNTSFINSEVLIMPGVQIVVPSGVTLNLDHTHLYACGVRMWQGIVVLDGGRVTSSNAGGGSSFIEDAVAGIDVDNNTQAITTNPIDLDNVIFNKNYIGIRIANSSLSTFPIRVNSCVFTSRDIGFASYTALNMTSWPNTGITGTDLRAAAPTATSNIQSPFTMNSMAPASIKWPYNGQQSEAGIRIESIDNAPGSGPNPGVDIGYTYLNGPNEFNLFDELKRGIEVFDASLSTMNNVFQNGAMQTGIGIRQMINIPMNARLNLTPLPGMQTTDFGNRFWNCGYGVEAGNVYDMNVQYNLFRSDRIVGPPLGRGVYGIYSNTNKFNYTISHNEFNDLHHGIVLDVIGAPFDVNGNNGVGVYADKLEINENYFGPEVSSSTMYVPNTYYLSQAITLNAWPSQWTNINGGTIVSNKIDRSFRGIRVNDFESFPLDISANSILLLDDNIGSITDQYGIHMEDSQGNLSVNQNTVTGEGVANTRMNLIMSINNTGNSSPNFYCNQVSAGYTGFNFSGPQPGTIWYGSKMTQPMVRGLCLSNSGAIGTQGNLTQECGARWFDASPDFWSNNWETYVNNSNAWPGSYLYVGAPPVNGPATNGGGGGMPFSYVGQVTLKTIRIAVDPCVSLLPYPLTPTQRTSATGISILQASEDVEITVQPNPTGSLLYVTAASKSSMQIFVRELSGRLLIEKRLAGGESMIDVTQLQAGVYLLEVNSDDGTKKHLKIIKL